MPNLETLRRRSNGGRALCSKAASCPCGSRRMPSVTAYAIRLTAFAVLSTLEPVVRIVLSILALTGIATCVLYRFVLHAPHFPLGRMLLLSIALAVLSVLYGLLVRATAP